MTNIFNGHRNYLVMSTFLGYLTAGCAQAVDCGFSNCPFNKSNWVIYFFSIEYQMHAILQQCIDPSVLFWIAESHERRSLDCEAAIYNEEETIRSLWSTHGCNVSSIIYLNKQFYKTICNKNNKEALLMKTWWYFYK